MKVLHHMLPIPFHGIPYAAEHNQVFKELHAVTKFEDVALSP